MHAYVHTNAFSTYGCVRRIHEYIHTYYKVCIYRGGVKEPRSATNVLTGIQVCEYSISHIYIYIYIYIRITNFAHTGAVRRNHVLLYYDQRPLRHSSAYVYIYNVCMHTYINKLCAYRGGAKESCTVAHVLNHQAGLSNAGMHACLLHVSFD
jgi:hypothetical protein